MHWLIFASIIWGFSFGIIKDLTARLDPFLLNSYRVALAAAFFTPWLFKQHRNASSGDDQNDAAPGMPKTFWVKNLQAFLCGSIQIGLMYGPYSLAFRFIKAHEVALFTMTTPLIMSALLILRDYRQIINGNRIIFLRLFIASFLATFGGLIVAYNGFVSSEIAVGFSLVQLSNLFFSLGLLLWTRWFDPSPKNLPSLMTPFFLGALFSCLILCLFFTTDWDIPSFKQWIALFWLGVISSGLGFFLWNKGALQVSETTLSVANNIKLPLAIIISITIFNENASRLPLLIGIILITMALQIGIYQPKTTQSR